MVVDAQPQLFGFVREGLPSPRGCGVNVSTRVASILTPSVLTIVELCKITKHAA